ncbi:TfuA-like protein [Rhizobium mongolense]|uniref:TfuA-like protein n=1 Tax=Rhizobium mongolense TaxID=57676 RepID=UPI0035567B6B
MAADVVVFLGPTLAISDARKHLDALYLPPAGGGDIAKAVITHAPSVIALVDGVFAQSQAVRHKEILWALSRGVRVFGASSMGAVRAAELAGYGMVGHGLIFRWYRRTVLADDADVAVPMAPAELGSCALGDALIDIRLTLKKAERERVIGRCLRRSLDSLARSIHYTERSYRTILSLAANESEFEQELRNIDLWLAEGERKQKRDDAVGLLTFLSSLEVNLAENFDINDFEFTEAFAYDMGYYNFPDILLCGSRL